MLESNSKTTNSLFHLRISMKSIRYLFGIILFLFSSQGTAQWMQEASYPAGVTNAAVGFSIGDSVYFGSGASGSTAFYKLDPSSGKWTRKSSLPLPSAAGVCFTIGSKGYVAFGESNPTGTDPLGSVTSDLWEYDPSLDQWTQKKSLPGTPRLGAFAFVIGNIAYVGGGGDSDGLFHDDFYSYDPTTDTWTTLQELPEYFCFWATFAIGDYGYIATGAVSDGELSWVWRYNPSTDSWTQMSDFPGAPRQAAVGFVLNGKAYVGLGEAQSNTVFSDFYTYDTTADRWTFVTSFPATHGRANANAVATSSAAFIGLGAYFSGQSLFGNSDIWSFSPTDGVATPTPVSNREIQSYPNPFSQSTQITFTSQGAGHAEVSIVNTLGVEVAHLFSGELGVGNHSFSWSNIVGQPDGTYECLIQMNGQEETLPVVLMH